MTRKYNEYPIDVSINSDSFSHKNNKYVNNNINLL